MIFEEREYQQNGINAAVSAMEEGRHALLQLPTGAGKAFMIARICHILIGKYGLNISILVDQETLVRQLSQTVKDVTGITPGIVCSGISKNIDWGKKITVGTRQTAVNHLHKAPTQHVLIADEAQLWKLQKTGEPASGQFAVIWAALRQINPDCKLLGFTATPYRLQHGWIFGKNNKDGFEPYFDELTYRVTYKELFDLGYLCVPELWIQSKEYQPDLSEVSLVAGEYNQGELGRVMLKYVKAVKWVVENKTEGYKHILIFAQDIANVEEICRITNGIVPVHSKLKAEEAARNMSMFKSGMVRGVASVDQLSVGFDFKLADFAILARPTNATDKAMQQPGRVMRIAPGKTRCCIADLVGNLEKHLYDFDFDFDNPIVKVPRASKKTGDSPVKCCPGYHKETQEKCSRTDLHAAVRICPECGHEFTRESIEELNPSLKKVEMYQPKEPVRMAVESMEITEHQGRESFKLDKHQGTAVIVLNSKGLFKRWMIRIVIKGGAFFTQESASLLLMFPDYYKGFPVEKSKKIWKQLSDDPFPKDVEDAAFLLERARQPVEIEYQEKGGYKNVTEMFFEGDIGKDEPDLCSCRNEVCYCDESCERDVRPLFPESTGTDVPF